jgi:hypothetical protein
VLSRENHLRLPGRAMRKQLPQMRPPRSAVETRCAESRRTTAMSCSRRAAASTRFRQPAFSRHPLWLPLDSVDMDFRSPEWQKYVFIAAAVCFVVLARMEFARSGSESDSGIGRTSRPVDDATLHARQPSRGGKRHQAARRSERGNQRGTAHRHGVNVLDSIGGFGCGGGI